MELIPFDRAHIPQAGELLAHRHRIDLQRIPLLPERFCTVEAACAAISHLFEKPGVTGVSAFEDGRILGYLLVEPLIDELWGRSAWVRLPGCALAEGQPPAHIQDMYTLLFAPLVEQGIFFHFAQVPAGDRELNNTWFALSFGIEQVYALSDLDSLDLSGRPSHPGITVRRATPEDRSIVEDMSLVISLHLVRAPVWGIRLPERAAAQRTSWGDLVEDPAILTWLAFYDGDPAGMISFWPSEGSDDDLLTPGGGIELGVAATHLQHRRKGVMQVLTWESIIDLRKRGYHVSLTDWRSTNLESARFWPRWGFRPAMHRLVRRVDARIAWGR